MAKDGGASRVSEGSKTSICFRSEAAVHWVHNVSGNSGCAGGRDGGFGPWVWLRGIGPARAEETRGKGGAFALSHEGVWVFASNARSSPVPLLLRYGSMRVDEETKCCALEVGTVMLRGRFLPVRGGVPRETFFLCQP